MISLVTYATHDAGNFKNLINNTYELKVKVLGMGTKWNGFMDKLNGMLDYVNTIEDQDSIVIYLDGFDVWINTPELKSVEQMFIESGHDILFSKESYFYPLMQRVFLKKEHRGNPVANTGLYMGRVGALKRMLEKIVSSNEHKDDQTAVNDYIYKKEYIKDALKNGYKMSIGIDIDEKIFKNVSVIKSDIKNSYTSKFIQNNGRLTFERVGRAWGEYNSYFINELCIAIFIIGLLWNKCWKIFISVILLFISMCIIYDQYFQMM